MNKRWRIELEITFDPKPDNWTGETETKSLALERVKVALNRMLETEPEIAHFHILKQPHTCYEFD